MVVRLYIMYTMLKISKSIATEELYTTTFYDNETLL